MYIMQLCWKRSVVVPHGGDDAAEDGDFVADDGFHVVVLRLEAELVILFVERLDGGFVLDERDDLVSVAGFGSPLGDDDVSVQNAGVDHTLAFDAQGEVGFIGRHGAVERDIAFDLFDGEDGLTGGDGAEERDLSGLGLRQADVQVDVALEAGVSRDVTGL